MKTLEADYIQNFTCDASKCDAYCCHNQNIKISDEMLSKYKHIKPPIKAKEITDYIKKGYIEFKYGVCPFFNPVNPSCSVQDEYDETYMPLICRSYPHYNNYFGNVFTVSFSLTCPVCRDIVLQNPNAVTLTADTIKWNATKIVNTYQNQRSELLPLYQKYGAIILQEENFSLDTRVALLEKYLIDSAVYNDVTAFENFSGVFISGMKNTAKELPEFDKEAFMTKMIFILINLYGPKGKAVDSKSIRLTVFVDKVFDMARTNEAEKEIDMKNILKLYDERFADAKAKMQETFAHELTNLYTHLFLFNVTPFLPGILQYGHAVNYLKLQYDYINFILSCAYFNLEEEFDYSAFNSAVGDLAETFENDIRIVEFFRALSTGV